MIGPLARRWAMALFLLISPGLGGMVVTALHGCTMVQGLPLATDGVAETAHHHGPTQGHPAHQHADGAICTCPAMVGIQAIATMTPSTLLPASPVDPGRAGWRVVERVDGIGRPIDRLPPATAPPRI